MTRRIELLTLTLVLVSTSLYACGDTDPTTASADGAAAADSTTDEEKVETTIDAYFQATSANEVCDNISLGFEAFLDGRSEPQGDPSAPADGDCPEVIDEAERQGSFDFEVSDVDVQHVLVDGDKAAARLVNPTLSDDPYPVFLVESSAGWLIAAENFAPPGFEGLYTDVMATEDASS